MLCGGVRVERRGEMGRKSEREMESAERGKEDRTEDGRNGGGGGWILKEKGREKKGNDGMETECEGLGVGVGGGGREWEEGERGKWYKMRAI